MDFQIAWRNLWRNPRRTAVVLTAVTIGIWALMFLQAFDNGFMVGMVKNAINTLTGHIQIHAPGYLDQPDIDHSMQIDSLQMRQTFEQTLPPGSFWCERIRVSTVATNARHSAGLIMIGCDWQAEKQMTFLQSALLSGSELTSEDPYAIVVGQALLKRFETKIGNKLILMAQDTQGTVASQAFKIVGAFNTGMESTEEQYAFVNREAAAKFLSMGDRLSEISILLPDSYTRSDQIQSLTSELKSKLGDTFDIRDWEQLQPAISSYVQMNESMNYIIIFVVFIAMGFGLVNTMLMAVHERVREFGLVKALGMHNWRIVRMVLIESTLLFAIGLVLGNFVGLGTVWYFSNHGLDLSSFAASTEFMGISRIVYFSLTVEDILRSNILVTLLGIAISLYPAFFATRFTPIEAMRHVN